MGQSYRIRTELGINKTITVSLEQDFEFLEILSLQIQQTEVYDRNCADYGVIVGRVTANNGFGIPNARVSVFIPITEVDQSNPLISSIYPYKSPQDVNEDGFRYNLLPYEKSYSAHAATGTLPTRLDVLTNPLVVGIYDKYYKLTAKTNDSGDYMIMGVPLGTVTLVMDVDLSDIGEFSLTPQDLIRMGLATESEVAGGRFKTSNDLNSLPQLINLQKDVEILPLWGDPDVCKIAITRADFDLRQEGNINIQPTAVFMGSVYSSPDKYRIRPPFQFQGEDYFGCRPKDNLGNLCELTTGPGQILAVRQTIDQDSEGNPVLEQYQLEQSGNIIDGDGVWLTELPMNLDYITTNEFGEKIISNDPTIGIPTKSKYRFKVKWQQPNSLTLETRRAYYLVPNVKEYGWNDNNNDPNTSPVTTVQKAKLSSSYYFGLTWSGYTSGFTGQEKVNRLNEIINCDDTFYEFNFNRVYTVSGLIDQWKDGGRGRFVGIKEIDDDSCSNTTNKFPVNDGVRNFDLLFFLFSVLITIIQPTLYFNLIVVHSALFFINIFVRILCILSRIKIPVINVQPFGFIRRLLPCNRPLVTFRLPMITYPDCNLCNCSQDLKTQQETTEGDVVQGAGVLSYLSLDSSYISKFEEYFSADTDNGSYYATIFSETIGGLSSPDFRTFTSKYKLPISLIRDIPGERIQVSSKDLPVGERINVFNSRKNYFSGLNKIKVKVEPNLNVGSDKVHYDNTITVLSNTQFNSGDLITAVNPNSTKDINYLWQTTSPNGLVSGISGVPYTTTAATSINISYAVTQTTSNSVTYNLPYGSDVSNYRYPADVEYFQVITAITWGDIIKIWNPSAIESFPNILTTESQLNLWQRVGSFPPQLRLLYRNIKKYTLNPLDFFNDLQSQYVLVLQRGVDPYSPKYTQEYNLGTLFGTNDNDPNFKITTRTRLNIPIQPNDSSLNYVQDYNQQKMYYQSYFFKPGIDGSTNNGELFSGYTTTNTGYYGLLDASTSGLPWYVRRSGNEITSKTSNGFYVSTQSGANYDLSEELSGGAIMGSNDYVDFEGMTAPITTSLFGNTYFEPFYYSKTIYSNVSYSSMTINNNVKNILRTDRLPSSDQLDGGSWDNNPALLQQNLNFVFYPIDTEFASIGTPQSSLGADQPQPDIVGLPNYTQVFETFNCESMVSLNCYEGFGSTFRVNQDCVEKDSVVKGCYTFLTRPLFGLIKDINNLSEWSYRFRFFYGLCRGVLSQSFVNNWVNGSLYAFPIQVNTFYDTQNKPTSVFCKELIHFDSISNNFYYRSSPWRGNVLTGKFIGKAAPPDTLINKKLNDRNLLYPTTLINLGMKDSYFNELSFEPSTKAYVMTELDSTTYGDTSDLVNLFVISRITDEGFLRRLTSALSGNNGLNQLFSRPGERIDGDLAQLMSINSELGVIKYSPEYYETNPNNVINPTMVLGTPSNPVIAVWYSSTTQNLQTKDYISPGRIDFRATPTSNFTPFQFGIKTQLVPFYRWQLAPGTPTIFGNQKNNWKTNTTDILQYGFQSLDRMKLGAPPMYFQSTTQSTTDLNNRGYIFSVDTNGNYSPTAAQSRSFIVGAPFHFYFGVVKGNSALDKFKTKYSIVE